MPIVVGIDEAGYGPLLGPLIVGATVWQVSPAALEDDFWRRLDGVLCRKPTRHEWRLPVDDSKKVYNRKKGLATLERTVLAFAAIAEQNIDTVSSFLQGLGTTWLTDESRPPWYQDLSQPLPRDRIHSSYEAIAQRLRKCMEASELCCRRLLAEVVPEHIFNRRVAQTRNKAAVLLEYVLRLVYRATAESGGQDVYVHVDRLGGRQDYRRLLLSAFGERHLHVQEVTEECSRYRLAGPDNDWVIDFHVDADQHYMPVALASMLAKYVRELLMLNFNAYWHELLPELRPTAGYYQDARRFLGDIQPALSRSGLRQEQFVRLR